MTFKELSIGQSFDFIAGNRFDSFFKRCIKTSARSYTDDSGIRHRIGSISAKVYHVG